MAEGLDIELLRQRGLTCKRLKVMAEKKQKDAKKEREVGFDNIAQSSEQASKKIKELHDKVCLLR